MIPIPKDIKVLIPWESHFFNYKEDDLIHFFDEGPRDAPVLVMVHGNPTWSFYFRSLIKKFSSSYRVVALDFLGMGLSSKTGSTKRRAVDRAAELSALLDHLAIDKFSIIMHDWGGPIGTRVAVDRVSKLQSIIYFNTTLTETESLPPFIKLAASGPLSKLITATTTQFLHFTTRLGCNKPLSRAVRNAYFLPFPTSASRKAVYDFVRDIPFSSEHPTHKDLADLAIELPKLSSIPTLILWGLKDPVFHGGMLKRVSAHFPHAKVIEYPDAAHLLLEDKPEELCREIESFLLKNNILLGAEFNSGPKSSAAVPQEQNRNYKEDDLSLVQSFFEKAEQSPDQPVSIEVKLPGILSTWPLSKLVSADPDSLNYETLSFKELRARILQYQRGLLALGISPGKRIIMLVSPGHDFLAFSFAIMACGAVPVFIDPGIGLEKLSDCIKDSAASGCVVSAKAQILMLLKRDLFKNMQIVVNASRLPIGFGTNLDFFSSFSAAETSIKPFSAQATALVAFTSGATGTPKGVVFSNSNLSAQMKIFKYIFGLKAGSRDLPLLPIFSLYGASSGVTSIFYPSNPGRPLDFDASHLCKVINNLSVETSFGSPTLWSKIATYAAGQAITFPSIKKVFMAGTSVSAKVREQVAAVCKNADLFTPYGATEALPVTLSPVDLLPKQPESANNMMVGIPVGEAVPNLQYKIISIVDGQIKNINEVEEVGFGEIGELIVSGPNISSQYLNRVDADQLYKITDGNSVWHRIGDACYMGKDANLYYCGRVAHRVITTDSTGKKNTLYSEAVEVVFNANPKVKRSALISIDHGIGAAVAIEPYPSFFPDSPGSYSSFIAELRALAETTSYTGEITEYFFFHDFPVDARHNAKIFRDQLGALASAGKSDYSVS